MGKSNSEEVVKDIIEKVQWHKDHTQSLRLRMEKDFGDMVLDEFQLSATEGEYDNVTANDPKTLADKIIEYISDGTLRFTCGILKDKKSVREKLSLTEYFAHGIVNLANERLNSFMMPDLKDALASNAVIRGWVGLRLFLYTGKDENLVVDTAVWDVRNTYWGFGKNGLAWGCYVNQEAPSVVEAKYGIDADKYVDQNGAITTFDYWDENWQRTIILDEQIDSVEHKLGYPPIFIMPVGSAPMFQNSDHKDGLLYQGESIISSNRGLIKVANKLLTYYLTAIGEGIRKPTFIEYSGAKPPSLPNNPHLKDQVIYLNVDKKQKVIPAENPVLPQHIGEFFNIIMGKINAGGAPPIMMGEAAGTNTVGGLNILSHNAMTIIKPRKSVVEKALSWFAKEGVRQYTNGKMEKIHIEGVDGRSKEFNTDISPDKLVTDRQIKAEIKLNLPQDDYQNANIIDMLVKDGIYSKQTGRDKMGIGDPDGEQGIIDREKAESIVPIALLRQRDAYMKDSDPEERKWAWFFDQAIKQMQQQAMQQAINPQGNPQGAPNPTGTAEMNALNPRMPVVQGNRPVNRGKNYAGY